MKWFWSKWSFIHNNVILNLLYIVFVWLHMLYPSHTIHEAHWEQFKYKNIRLYHSECVNAVLCTLPQIRNPHFHTSWYKLSYDTRAKKRFLDKCDYITRLRVVLQTHTRQKTFHRTRIVMYYFLTSGFVSYHVAAMNRDSKLVCNTSRHGTKNARSLLVGSHFTELFSNSSGPKVKTFRKFL